MSILIEIIIIIIETMTIYSSLGVDSNTVLIGGVLNLLGCNKIQLNPLVYS